MVRFNILSVTAVVVAVALTCVPVSSTFAGGETSTAPAENQDAIKSAFESAKDLGTADAWNAFLSNFPSGFYADMARAYLKKMSDTAPAQPAQEPAAAPAEIAPPPSSARAGERSCSERETLRSQHSREPTKITFVNNSGMYRALMWVDFEGNLKDYGGLNSGESRAFETFRTHPWMIATGPGDCSQIFLPAAEPATVELFRLAADDPPVRAAPVTTQNSERKQAQPPPKKLKCGQNYKLKNGECVLLQNCGKNARRSPEGDCYCKKGYVMRNGKCQWPQDKQGFEVAPWKKQGCSTWQAQCSQGNGGSCQKYEENCQVN